MITSSIQKQLDTVLNILSDSKKLSKLIEDLKKADKNAKDSFKELSAGKAYKAALEDIEKEAEGLRKEVDKAKKYLKTAKDKADTYTKESHEKIKSEEIEISLKEAEVKFNLAEAQIVLKQAEAEYVKAQKVNKAAQDEKTKAVSLRKQYEERLSDIKSRLAGL